MTSTTDRLWTTSDDRPRRGLSAQRIVETAIELADAEGLEAVSMSKVAKQLEAGTMSLYRHVASKDELVSLMVDVAVAAPATPAPSEVEEAAGWRAALERWAYDLLAVVRKHPWVLDVPLARHPLGPGRAVWLERGLAALAGTALEEHEKAAVILVLNGFVFTEARTAAEITSPDAAGAFSAGLVEHLDAARYPALRHALEARIFEDAPDPDGMFAFGLERVLDGIEKLVELRRAR